MVYVQDAPIHLDAHTVWIHPYICGECQTHGMLGHPHMFRMHPNIGVWMMFGCPLYIHNTKQACFVKESMLCHTKRVSICHHTFGFTHRYGYPHTFEWSPICWDTPICLDGPLYVGMLQIYLPVCLNTPICLDAPVS